MWNEHLLNEVTTLPYVNEKGETIEIEVKPWYNDFYINATQIGIMLGSDFRKWIADKRPIAEMILKGDKANDIIGFDKITDIVHVNPDDSVWINHTLAYLFVAPLSPHFFLWIERQAYKIVYKEQLKDLIEFM